MKQVYAQNGYEVYETKICGYPCTVHKTVSSGCAVHVPMGDTTEDKAMFDDLVYNKHAYFGKTPREAVERVSDFIKSYKHKV